MGGGGSYHAPRGEYVEDEGGEGDEDDHRLNDHHDVRHVRAAN